MLAASLDGSLDEIKYPVLATPKIDGIRCLIIDGVATSRSLKPIPNRFIQSVIGQPIFNGLDGELVVSGSFQDVTSGIMSEDGEPNFLYMVFDRWDLPGGYRDRVNALKVRFLQITASHFGEAQFVRVLDPVEVASRAALEAYSEKCLAEGHEGVMIRTPGGSYKHGRATFREGSLTKIKPFEDAEAVVVGVEEQMHNGNAATTNALGRTERSSHKANLVPKGTMGALICSNQALWPGQTFNIGTGFDDATRADLWRRRNDPAPNGVIGATVKFRYQKIGTKDKPRIPTFLGFRDSRDL